MAMLVNVRPKPSTFMGKGRVMTKQTFGSALKQPWAVSRGPIFHKLEEAIRGHVFCSLFELVLKKALEDRIVALGLACLEPFGARQTFHKRIMTRGSISLTRQGECDEAPPLRCLSCGLDAIATNWRCVCRWSI
jgi:hypothetical protein